MHTRMGIQAVADWGQSQDIGPANAVRESKQDKLALIASMFPGENICSHRGKVTQSP